MKKLICGLLALCLVICLLPTAALAAEVDATALVEILQRAESLRWGYDNRISTSGVAVTADNTTQRSYTAFITAKEAAQEELSKLYDEDGNPTPYNDAAGEAPANVAVVVADMEAAIADLDKKADDDGIADARVGYDTLKNLLAKAFNPARMDQSRYTEDSWTSFLTAYDTAQTYMYSHIEPVDDIGVWEADGWVKAAYDYWQACFEGLTDCADEVSVTLCVNDAYSLQVNRTPSFYCGTYSISLPTAEATVKNVLRAALGNNYNIKPGSDAHYAVGLYINGVYVSGESSSFSQQMLSSKNYENVRVKNGDMITLSFMYAPVWTSMIGAQTTAPASEVVGDIQYFTTDSDLVEATSGEDVSLQVRYNLAMPAAYNGAILPKEGIRVYISDVCATEAEARCAAATHEVGTTDHQGMVEIAGFSAPNTTEGWYVVSFFGSGDRGGLGNGMNVLLHVTDPADLTAIKELLQARLYEIYTAYPEEFYKTEQLQAIYAAYEAGIAGIENAVFSGTANQSYEEAKGIICSIQNENNESLNTSISLVRAILSYLPTEQDLDAGRLYGSDKELLDLLFGDEGVYTGMSAFQKNQLKYAESILVEKLLARYKAANSGEALPETPSFTLSFKAIDIDTGEEVEGLVVPRANSIAYWELSDFWLTTTDSAGRFVLYNQGDAVYNADDATEIVVPAGGYYQAMAITRFTSTEYTYVGRSFNVDERYFSKNLNTFTGLREDVVWTVYVQKRVDEVVDPYPDELKSAFETFKKVNYTAENWKTLVDSYNAGLAAIRAVTTEEEKQAALDSAVEAMNAVPQKDFATYGYGKVLVSFSNTTTPVSNQTHQAYDSTLYNPDGPIFTCEMDLLADDSMMTVLLRALSSDEYNGLTSYTWLGTGANEPDGYDITYLSTVSNGLDSLAEFDGGADSGWMGKLNDFFVNLGFDQFTVSDGKLTDGDVIEVVYTTNLGVDVGGAWGNPDTTLKDLTISGGTLLPAFNVQTASAGDTLEYAVVIGGNSALLTVTPDANNKNYLVKTFLNEKVTSNVEGSSFYKRTQPVPVAAGDTVYVGVGMRAWPSMNKQGAEASSYTGTWYVLHVINSDGIADYVNGLIHALPAVTYGNYMDVQQKINVIDSTHAEGQSGIDQNALEAARRECKVFADFDELRNDLKAITVGNSMDTASAKAFLSRYDELLKHKADLIYNLTKAEVNKIEAIRRAVYIYGDINGDGKINIADAALLAAYVRGSRTLTDEQLLVADVNADKKVNIADASMLAQYVRGTRSSFPANSH